ncbi:uncharacterized protein LOC144119650 [Amblyomma americanum]
MGCGASKGRRQARSAALSYALVSFVFLAVHLAVMFLSAMVCEAKRRPYVWLSKGFGCLLRVANLGFIIAWIVAVGQDSLQHMVFCTTAIATRLLGLCIYAVVYNVHDKVKAESSADMIQFTLHWEELSSHFVVPATLMTAALEAYFLCSLIRYQRNFTPRSSDQEEAAAAASGSSAEADHAAAAGGGSPAGASHGSDSSGSGNAGGK